MRETRKGIAAGKRRILIVEGKDDQLVIEALISRMHLTSKDEIQIFPIGGKDNFSANLRTLLLDPEFVNIVSMGIMRDADLNATNAFASVRDTLGYVKLSAPNRAGMFTATSPRIGILILPPDQKTGCLEDVFCTSVMGTMVGQCLEDFFTCLDSHGITHTANKKAKAFIHAYIASQAEPDLQFGTAVSNGSYWNWDHPAFDPIKRFLTDFATA